MLGVFLYFKTQIFEYRQQKAVRKLFYQNSHYQQVDQALLRNYRSTCPYRISKRYMSSLEKKNLHVYGETPLTTMALIAKECELSERDFVIEMGAGRGRAALFLAEYIGCRVLAYEQIDEFIERMPPSKNLTMIWEDMFSASFAGATLIYLYGTLLEDEEISILCKNFPSNVKILTVSYPLSEYSPEYTTLKSFTGYFPWGKAEIFINERAV